MGIKITDEQFSYYLYKMQCILDHTEGICTNTYNITKKWYKLYEKNYKWYWGFKLNYEKFLNKLSDEFYLKIVVSYLGYKIVLPLPSTENCTELNTKIIKKYTKLSDNEINDDVSKLIQSFDLIYRNRTLLCKVHDTKEQLIRYKNIYKIELNYMQLLISCDEFIEKYNVKIEK